MANNKYHVTSLDTFELDTETQTYNVNVEVDSFEFITIEIGDSFSLRFNYDQAEKIESVLKSARHLIQDMHIDNAGRSIKNLHEQPSDWNPSDPTNW